MHKEVWTMKKLLFVFIFSVVLSSFSSCAHREYQLYFVRLEDNTYKLTSVSGCLPENFKIPSEYKGEKVTVIGSKVTYYCENPADVLSILLPDTIHTIEFFAFENLTELQNVHFGKSIRNIDADAFTNTNLYKISLSPENQFYTIESGCLINTKREVVIGTNISQIPSDITGIKAFAFQGRRDLKQIEIPSACTVIEEHAFQNCSSLKDIKICEGVANIEQAAFYGTAIKEIVIPGSIRKVEDIFFNCHQLEKITLSEGCTELGKDAFSYCHNLKKVILPSTLSKITNAGGFDSVSDANMIEIHPENQMFEIRDNCLIEKTSDRLILAFHPSIPEGIKIIGEHAFWKVSIGEKLLIPNGILKIESSAFHLDENTLEVILPQSVSILEYHAFYLKGNTKIRCEVSDFPMGWDDECFFLYDRRNQEDLLIEFPRN